MGSTWFGWWGEMVANLVRRVGLTGAEQKRETVRGLGDASDANDAEWCIISIIDVFLRRLAFVPSFLKYKHI